MKWIAPTTLVIIVILIGLSDYQHREQKAEILQFIAEGDRNTADEGWDRDILIAEIEARLFNLETQCLREK